MNCRRHLRNTPEWPDYLCPYCVLEQHRELMDCIRIARETGIMTHGLIMRMGETVKIVEEAEARSMGEIEGRREERGDYG